MRRAVSHLRSLVREWRARRRAAYDALRFDLLLYGTANEGERRGLDYLVVLAEGRRRRDAAGIPDGWLAFTENVLAAVERRTIIRFDETRDLFTLGLRKAAIDRGLDPDQAELAARAVLRDEQLTWPRAKEVAETILAEVQRGSVRP